MPFTVWAMMTCGRPEIALQRSKASINASRNISREARNFLPEKEAHDLRRTIVLRQIAYVNALRCQLRKQPVDEQVLKYLSRGEAEPGSQVTLCIHPEEVILERGPRIGESGYLKTHLLQNYIC